MKTLQLSSFGPRPSPSDLLAYQGHLRGTPDATRGDLPARRSPRSDRPRHHNERHGSVLFALR
jgi:hypothetical protein